ncbi:MAG TPA: vitamin K epoxide reductase family protein [Vicinamibacterales bacterium]|nr:vitamin K epoxide reductase family protein [Vicinamibacterales bacterium]
MTPRARWIVLAFALAGLAFASASAWVHYRVLTDPTYISPCDINAHFSCSQVYLSRFGSVWGVPVAIGGMIWFALVALLAGFAKPAGKDASSATGLYIFALATIGLAVILYLGYASLVVLKTGCILCIGTYVCVIGIFVTAGLQTTTGWARLPGRLFSDLRAAMAQPLFLTVAFLYIAGAATAIAFFPREGQTPAAAPATASADIKQQFTNAWWQQPRVDLGIPADGAKVVVVKFNDWLCPACKGAHMFYQPIFDKLAKESPGAVKYVIKDWPWNSECNFNVTQTLGGHQGSCAAAASVRMARDRNKADEMIEWLFTNQQHLVELGMQGGSAAADAIRQHATETLGVTNWAAEYAKKLPDIRRDVADGGALSLGSTPTFYVNGVKAADGRGSILPPEYFELALRLEIAKATGK